MGRSRFQIYDASAPHFLTCTVVGWTPLFTRPVTAQIILDALAYRQQNERFKLYGYVILENHLHCIIQTDDLSKEIHSFKSYTARSLIDCLKEHHATKVLEQLAFHKKLHKRDRDYQVWEEG